MLPLTRHLSLFSLLLASVVLTHSASPPAPVRKFIEKNCAECHDADVQKAGLNLVELDFNPANSTNFPKWVLIHDRVDHGEMPPAKKDRPDAKELASFKTWLSTSLAEADEKRIAKEGRATRRRLNRYEYESALRDLLSAPWLQIRDALPEDGELERFNKVGEALDMSHVQMARDMSAADYDLRQVMAPYAERPETKPQRYYTREQRSFTGPMKFNEFNTAPERATFPVLGFEGQPAVRRGEAPVSYAELNPELRELEGVGVVASAYEPIEPKFNNFRAPVPGRYKLRFNAHTVWVGPGPTNKWFIPDLDNISKGRRDEPVSITAEIPPRLLRHLRSEEHTSELQSLA